MRVRWVQKAKGSSAAGEDIYDLKMVNALLKRGVDVEAIQIPRVPKSRELLNLLSGSPYYRAKYFCDANIEAFRHGAAQDAATVCSWEPLDQLAFASGLKIIPILHNVTSQALRSMYPGNPATAFLANRAASWERRAYRSPTFPFIGVLSRDDAARLSSIVGQDRILYLPPGLPPTLPLATTADVTRELLVLGTFGWRPKRRDIMRMTAEHGSLAGRWSIFADELPEPAQSILRARPATEADMSASIRIGVVTDRFSAGHKLKVGSYIASNAAVASYADVRSEYRGIEDSDLFIWKIDHLSDVERMFGALAALGREQLRERWLGFQRRCQDLLSWDRSAGTLLRALTEMESITKTA
jgi:hypothetical protein